MDFKKYQKFTNSVAVYPKLGKKFVYPALGLAGEAGEIADKVKKIFRDKSGRVKKKDKEEIAKELGDVMWYVSQVATEFGLSLDEVAKENVKKLKSRKKRGKIHGDGDNR